MADVVRRMLDQAAQRALGRGYAPEAVEAHRARLAARIDVVEDLLREKGNDASGQ